ncbi:MAG TPA: hypothetical protein VJR58_28790 [Vineibacter sp.]|nr:hypothetical protein [Vineibacter sp.]
MVKEILYSSVPQRRGSVDIYYERFKDLSGTAKDPGGATLSYAGVKCRRYLNTKMAFHEEAAPNIDGTLALIRQRSIPVPDYLPNQLKNGKGQPEDMEAFLNMAIAAGKFSAGASGGDRDISAAVQTFADSALGVDCTGLVYGYMFRGQDTQMEDIQQKGKDGKWTTVQYNVLANGGSCPFFYTSYADKAVGDRGILWNPATWAEGDVLLWMYSNGFTETRSPGHCGLVVSADTANNRLIFVQSGSDAGGGPERVEKWMAGPAETTWKTKQTDKATGLSYLSMDTAVSSRFICVRPRNV